MQSGSHQCRKLAAFIGRRVFELSSPMNVIVESDNHGKDNL